MLRTRYNTPQFAATLRMKRRGGESGEKFQFMADFLATKPLDALMQESQQEDE